MSSSTEICNSALIKLGQERISSLSESNKRARLCNEQYSKLRDSRLQSHYWNFAMARAQLSLVSGSPEFGFDYRYQLPTDCLKAVHLNDKTARFKVEENAYVHTNLVEAELLYVKKVTDESKYSPMFRELLAYDIAIDLCTALTQKRTLKQDLIAERKEFLRDVRSADGQEGTNDQLMADTWLESRWGDPTGDYGYEDGI